jgi:acyl-CoA thioester hydrolase
LTSRFEIEVPMTIPFHDVDSLGIVWHGHYAKYFEIARCALLERLGYGYDAMRESGYSWPVIDMHVRYVKPMRFNQQVTVRATLREWENRLLIHYLITDRDGRRLTKGTTSQVAVDMNGEMQFVSPPVLFERLGVPR